MTAQGAGGRVGESGPLLRDGALTVRACTVSESGMGANRSENMHSGFYYRNGVLK